MFHNQGRDGGWARVGAAHPSFLEGGRRPPKLFFRLGGRAHHGATAWQCFIAPCP